MSIFGLGSRILESRPSARALFGSLHLHYSNSLLPHRSSSTLQHMAFSVPSVVSALILALKLENSATLKTLEPGPKHAVTKKARALITVT